MPEAKLLTRLISQLRKNGKSPQDARKIAIASLQKSGNLHAGSTKPTSKGVRRGNMTPAQRAIDRAKKANGGGDFKYNPHNNTAVKGHINPHVKPRA